MSEHTPTTSAVKASSRHRILEIDTITLLLPENISGPEIQQILDVMDASQQIRTVYHRDGFAYAIDGKIRCSYISDRRTIYPSVAALQASHEEAAQ